MVVKKREAEGSNHLWTKTAVACLCAVALTLWYLSYPRNIEGRGHVAGIEKLLHYNVPFVAPTPPPGPPVHLMDLWTDNVACSPQAKLVPAALLLHKVQTRDAPEGEKAKAMAQSLGHPPHWGGRLRPSVFILGPPNTGTTFLHNCWRAAMLGNPKRRPYPQAGERWPRERGLSGEPIVPYHRLEELPPGNIWPRTGFRQYDPPKEWWVYSVLGRHPGTCAARVRYRKWPPVEPGARDWVVMDATPDNLMIKAAADAAAVDLAGAPEPPSFLVVQRDPVGRGYSSFIRYDAIKRAKGWGSEMHPVFTLHLQAELSRLQNIPVCKMMLNDPETVLRSIALVEEALKRCMYFPNKNIPNFLSFGFTALGLRYWMHKFPKSRFTVVPFQLLNASRESPDDYMELFEKAFEGMKRVKPPCVDPVKWNTTSCTGIKRYATAMHVCSAETGRYFTRSAGPPFSLGPRPLLIPAYEIAARWDAALQAIVKTSDNVRMHSKSSAPQPMHANTPLIERPNREVVRQQDAFEDSLHRCHVEKITEGLRPTPDAPTGEAALAMARKLGHPEHWGARLRPTVFILGPPKAGTTFLEYCWRMAMRGDPNRRPYPSASERWPMKTHPTGEPVMSYLPIPQNAIWPRKGPRYIDPPKEWWNYPEIGKHQGHCFEKVHQRRWPPIEEGVENWVVMDATPDTLMIRSAADAVAVDFEGVTPLPKFLVSIRDAVSRGYSHFLLFTELKKINNWGEETEPVFAKHVKEELYRLKKIPVCYKMLMDPKELLESDVLVREALTKCMYYPNRIMPNYFSFGFTALGLSYWLTKFPPSQFTLVRQNELKYFNTSDTLRLLETAFDMKPIKPPCEDPHDWRSNECSGVYSYNQAMEACGKESPAIGWQAWTQRKGLPFQKGPDEDLEEARNISKRWSAALEDVIRDNGLFIFSRKR